MHPAFLITNRQLVDGNLNEFLDEKKRRYFVCDAPGADLTQLSNWTQLEEADFIAQLLVITAAFPDLPDERNEEQKHVTLFIHGYNNTWREAAQRYAGIKANLFDGPSGLGVPILFTWPSDGTVVGYLPDREDARASAPQVADLLVMLHEHLVVMQRAAAISKVRLQSVEGSNRTSVCCAKVSIIAHSMGNFVMQKALAVASKKLNNPQLITLIHQLVMVAADVDNDIFQSDKPTDSDGALMTNLCYRITSLYSGLDPVLGASAGLKHFGTRRLGRSGLATPIDVPDNVAEIDVSDLIKDTPHKHSGVFDSTEAMALLERVLRGLDRRFLLPAN